VLLADIGWHDHPDYRAEHAFWRVLRLPAVAIDHRERALLALAIHVRYHGHIEAELLGSVTPLLAKGDADAALVLGLALRLAYTLSGGVAGVLKGSRLAWKADGLALQLPTRRRALAGEVVGRRLEALGNALKALPRR
jgi:exopolyphosphatase / guanosine-5'-triphosphate,3'-diphosphate pyrophosphatase